MMLRQLIILGFLSTLGLVACNAPQDIAGTTNTPNARVAGIVIRDSVPVPGATVCVRPREYLTVTGDTADLRLMAYTDSSGHFSITGIPEGRFTFEVMDSSNGGLLLRKKILPDIDSLHDFGRLELRKTGQLVGRINTENISDTVAMKVGLYGLERTSTVENGLFYFNNLPPADYEFFIASNSTFVGNYSGVTTILEDEKTVQQDISLPVDFRIDSIRVRSFLDSQRISVFDWEERIKVSANRITKINLSKLGITRLHSEIAELQTLLSINLGYNPIAEFPSPLLSMPRVNELIFSGIQVDSLWPDLQSATWLLRLTLDSMSLRSVPDNFDTLSRLCVLSMDNNEFTDIPPQIGRLPELKRLSMENNRLRRIDQSLYTAPLLEHLSLGNNEIDSLSPEIELLSGLTWLNLSGNRLKALPGTIGNLRNLTYLNLQSNLLDSLPETIGYLSSLNRAFLSSNHLRSLPLTIISLPRAPFVLFGNQLCDLSPEIVQWLDQKDTDWRASQDCN